MSANKSENNLFQNAVYAIFYNWTSLQLAVNNNFGGSDTKEKAEWFINATYQWIVENDGLDDDELEDFFIDTMNNEFNTILDDNSAIEIARNLIECYNLYKSHQYAQLEGIINKLGDSFSKKQNSIKVDQVDDESSSEDDGEEDGDENNNQVTHKEEEEEDMELNQAMESVEEGWTLVYKGGKHVTK